jgi:hypothetical protein
VDTNGICALPDGSANGGCAAASPGLYAGVTDQGLPVSFEVSGDGSQIINFAIDTQLQGPPGTTVPRHQIRWGPGFPLLGCGFADTLDNGEYSGSFSPPHSFTGLWSDSVTIPQNGEDVIYSAGGTWSAIFGGSAGDGGAQMDGGAALDGGAADGGAVADGGAADGGAQDGGAQDGGGAPILSLPAGFSADIVAANLAGPIALALDPASGDLYFAETFAGTVTRLRRDGSLSLVLSLLRQPRGLSFVHGATDLLYASDESGITVVPTDGSADPTAFGPALSFPAGPLLCDATPRCIVAELRFGERRQSVWRVTADSVDLVAGPNDGIDQPLGLVGSGDGLLITDANLGFPPSGALFHVVSPDGGVTGFTPAPLVAGPGPAALLGGTRYAVGEVVIAGAGDDRNVFVLDRATFRTRPFAHGFAVPIALAYDNGRQELFVVDLSRGALYRVRGPFDSL